MLTTLYNLSSSERKWLILCFFRVHCYSSGSDGLEYWNTALSGDEISYALLFPPCVAAELRRNCAMLVVLMFPRLRLATPTTLSCPDRENKRLSEYFPRGTGGIGASTTSLGNWGTGAVAGFPFRKAMRSWFRYRPKDDMSLKLSRFVNMESLSSKSDTICNTWLAYGCSSELVMNMN